MIGWNEPSRYYDWNCGEPIPYIAHQKEEPILACVSTTQLGLVHFFLVNSVNSKIPFAFSKHIKLDSL